MCPAALAAAKTPDAATLMPDKTLLYAGWAGLGPEGKTWSQQIERWVGALPNMDMRADDRKGFARVMELIGTALQYPGGVGIFDARVKPEGGPMRIEGAAVIVAGEDSARIAELLRQIVLMGDDQAELEERTVSDVKLRCFKLPGDAAELLWGVHKDVFLLALSDVSATQVIARINGSGPSLAENDELRFDRAKVQAAPDDYGFCLYADVPGIIAAAQQVAAALKADIPPVIDRALDEFGIRAVRSKYLHVDRREGQWRWAGFAHVTGERRGLLKIWDQAPLTDDDLKIIPPDAHWAYVTNLDLSGLWKEALRVVEALDPEAPPKVEAGVAASKQFLGFSVPDELLPAFGDTWALFDAPDNGGFLVTGIVLVAEVRDADAVQRMLAQLVQALHPLVRMGKGDLQLKESQHGGHAIHYVLLGGLPSPVAPAWGIVNQRCVFGLFPQTVATALKQVDAATRGPTLLDHPDFQTARARLPKEVHALSFTDESYMTRAFYPLLTPLVTLGMSFLGKADKQLDLLAMYPPLPDQLANAKISVGSTSTDRDGILMLHSGGGLPFVGAAGAVSAVSLATSIALPALASGREEARRVVSRSNLHSIGVACIAYAQDHRGVFPKALDELIPTGMITAKELHSPRDPMPEDHVSYAYIGGQIFRSSNPRDVLAYEPIADNGRTNVLFVDAHVESMDAIAFRQAVRETYKRLGRENELPEEFAE
jgi:prepilin-type processing-associated H-X9-DG protein